MGFAGLWRMVPMVWYSILQARQMAADGRIRPSDHLYDSRRARWSPARNIPELAPYFPKANAWAGAIAAGSILAALFAARDRQRLRHLSWEELRDEIFQRDNYTCTYCGQRRTAAYLEVDHRVPLARSGSDDPDNLVTACWECNREKGTMTEWEYRLWRGA